MQYTDGENTVLRENLSSKYSDRLLAVGVEGHCSPSFWAILPQFLAQHLRSSMIWSPLGFLTSAHSGSLPHCKATEHGRSFESLYLQFPLPEKLFPLIYVSFRSPFQGQICKRACSGLLAGVSPISFSHLGTALFYFVCNIYYDLKLPIDGLIACHPSLPLAWKLLVTSAIIFCICLPSA